MDRGVNRIVVPGEGVSMRKPEEPFFWGLFSAGGVVSAMVAPAHLLLLCIAIPMGWIDTSYTHLHSLMENPLAKG